MVDDRTVTFINSLDPGLPTYLEDLEKEAISAGVPIIRKDMQAFMRFLMASLKPSRILEVGTAIGFSALVMREYNPVCNIVTIENYPERIKRARENFDKYDIDKRIRLIDKDATEVLPELNEEFDFIFMDAAKGQYVNFLPRVMKLLSPGGILLSDNVLQDGDIIESKYAVRRRDRTIHNRMREYLYILKHSKELTTAILPVGDGCSISYKTNE